MDMAEWKQRDPHLRQDCPAHHFVAEFQKTYFTLLQIASYCDIFALIVMKKSLVHSFAEKVCYHILNKKAITKITSLENMSLEDVWEEM